MNRVNKPHQKVLRKQLDVVSYIPNNGKWLNENHVSIWRGKTVWCPNIKRRWQEINIPSMIYLFIYKSFWHQCIFASIILWSIINDWLSFFLNFFFIIHNVDSYNKNYSVLCGLIFFFLYKQNIFTTNYKWLIVIDFNLNLLLRLIFYTIYNNSFYL